MSFETPAILTSILMVSMSILGFVLNRRSARPAKDRMLTITIEDSAGVRTRTVTRSDRRVDDVTRDVERLVGQAS
jgi:hypothetical protein